MTRRFSNGLQFMAAYTFSHNIDDSTAEAFSTYTTPRRPQNIRNLRADRTSSALDHRHRLTYQVMYAPAFFNILNHSQYVGGSISDVAPIGFTGAAVHNFTIPSTSVFHQASQVFSSNPRSITVSAKFTF